MKLSLTLYTLILVLLFMQGKSSTVGGDSARGHEQAVPRRKLNSSEDASRLLLELPSSSRDNSGDGNNNSYPPTIGARKDVSWFRGKREVKAPSRFLLRLSELQPQAEGRPPMRRKQAPSSASSSLRFGRKRYRGSTRVLDRQRKREQLAAMLKSNLQNAALAPPDQNESDNATKTVQVVHCVVTNKTKSNDELAVNSEEATHRVRRTVVIIFILIFVATTASALFSCYRKKKAESAENAAPAGSAFGMYRKKAASVDSASFVNSSEKKSEQPGAAFLSFFGKRRTEAEEIPPFYCPPEIGMDQSNDKGKDVAATGARTQEGNRCTCPTRQSDDSQLSRQRGGGGNWRKQQRKRARQKKQESAKKPIKKAESRELRSKFARSEFGNCKCCEYSEARPKPRQQQQRTRRFGLFRRFGQGERRDDEKAINCLGKLCGKDQPSNDETDSSNRKNNATAAPMNNSCSRNIAGFHLRVTN